MPPLSPASWSPEHPQLRQSLAAGFVPAVRAALAAGEPERVLEQPHPGLFRFRLLDQGTCVALSSDLARYERWAAERGTPPNSMNRYGAVLSALGYGPAMDELFCQLVRPLAEHVFPQVGSGLVGVHPFSVAYGDHQDHALGFHVDDSDVTLNLCLGDRFSGAELFFRGRRCTRHRESDPRPEERVDVVHEPGVAWLHAGAVRHGVHPIERGVRRNLILWCQSPSDRNDPTAPCPAWCGEHAGSAGSSAKRSLA